MPRTLLTHLFRWPVTTEQGGTDIRKNSCPPMNALIVYYDGEWI